MRVFERAVGSGRSCKGVIFQYLLCCAVVELTPQVGATSCSEPMSQQSQLDKRSFSQCPRSKSATLKRHRKLYSTLTVSPFLSGPLSQIKSSLLGSTSDSNLNKYSTINKIPLIALNFSEASNDKKCPSPPSSEKTIIAPKVKDRTHNVTDKVTQVWAYCRTHCTLIPFSFSVGSFMFV